MTNRLRTKGDAVLAHDNRLRRNDQPTRWFPVKRYGWGWGLPVRWQGWLVFVAYLALLYGGIHYFVPMRAALSLFVYVLGLTAVLIAVVAWKGERPLRWRWGKE